MTPWPRLGGLRLSRRLYATKLRPSYFHNASSRPLLYETINQQLTGAIEDVPDKELFVFCEQGIRKTYQELYEDARDLAAGLVHLGIRRGDRVGIWGPNYYEWTVTQFAAAMAGNILVNVNPAYQVEELRFALKKVGVKALITPPKFRRSDYYRSLCAVIPQLTQERHGAGALTIPDLPEFRHLIVFNTGGQEFHGAHDFNEVIRAGGSRDRHQLDEQERLVRPDDPANIQFTSGTTGLPKAATLSHYGMVNNAESADRGMGFHEIPTRLCIPNPLYHCFGCVLGTIAVVAHRQTAIFPSAWFDAAKVCESLETERVTSIYGTPTMFVDILAHERFKQVDSSSLKSGLMSGAPCASELCRQLVEDVGLTDFHLGYGSTETSPLITLSRLSDPPTARITNVGYPLEHLEVSLVDANGKVVPRGERGHLLCRGYSVMHGYWDDNEATQKAVGTDRCDVAIMNEDDSIVHCGRSKEMIIRGGENIYPAEIEQFLFQHDAVEDVYVVGIPSERWGEEVCAVVRLKAGASLTGDELKQFARGKIAHYKIPTFVIFKSEHQIPQTATGKVQKFRLRELCARELGRIDDGAALDNLNMEDAGIASTGCNV